MTPLDATIRVCCYRVPVGHPSEAISREVLGSGAHIYCLLEDDFNDVNRSRQLIQNLIEQKQWTYVDSSCAVPCKNMLCFEGGARIYFDSDRFSTDSSFNGYQANQNGGIEIRDNVTGRDLFISSLGQMHFKINGKTCGTIAHSKVRIHHPVSESSRVFHLSSLPLPSEDQMEFFDSMDFSEKSGYLVNFEGGEPAFERSLTERISLIGDAVFLFIRSIFMTTYVDPTPLLQESPLDGGPQIIDITFTPKASLINRIGNWFRDVCGCAAHGQESVQSVN